MSPGNTKPLTRNVSSKSKHSSKKRIARTKTQKGTQSPGGTKPKDVFASISHKLDMPVNQVSRVIETLDEVTRESASTARIVKEYKSDPGALIQILLEIQREYNWLPQDILVDVCDKLDIPLNRAYRIATFYKAFSLVPRGRHLVRVCMGTACHVRGAPRLLDRTTQVLGIEPGESTRDMRFSLETVNCLGCCAIGPALVIDEDTLSNPSVAELEEALSGRE